jgi:hypothetical protein
MELFLSYARHDATQARGVQGRLNQLGHSVWVDQRLTGGQQWWNEILGRIARSDALVVIVSHHSLRSAACAAERGYAAALRRPILPVLIERLPTEMLPSDMQLLQLVDYTEEGADSVIGLASAVAHLPTPPPLPDPLPAPPVVPLSYLSQLGNKLTDPAALDLGEQVSIAARLEAALRAADVEEAGTARELMLALRQRGDLFAETQRIIDRNDLTAPAPVGPTPRPTPSPERQAPAAKRPGQPDRPPGQPDRSPGRPDRPPHPQVRPGQVWTVNPPPEPAAERPDEIYQQPVPAPSTAPGPPPGMGLGGHPGRPVGAQQPPPRQGTKMTSNTKAWLWIGGIALALVVLCVCLGTLQCSAYGC